MTTTQAQQRASPPRTSAQTQRFNPRDDGPSCPPTQEEIARVAYDLYVTSGWIQGQNAQNWQQAEQSLREQGRRQAQQRGSGAFASPSTKTRGAD